MQRKRAFIATVLLVAMVFAPQRAVAGDKLLIVGDDNHPPYSFTDKLGRPAGVYVKVLEAAIERLPNSQEVSLQLMPWKRALLEVKSGRAFAIFPPHFFPDKRPYIWPYSLPLLEELPVVACRDDIVKMPATWPDDFLHLRIGTSAGVKMGGEAFWQAVDNGRVSHSEQLGVVENLNMIIKGRIDCHINDMLTIQWALDNLLINGGKYSKAASTGIRIIMPVSLPEHGFLGYSSVWKGPDDLKHQVQKNIETVFYAMVRNGEIDDILRTEGLYFPTD